MPVSRALKRLLGVRELEEEQYRVALTSAINERTRLRKALQLAADRARRGRALITHSVGSGELYDRLAGLEEVRGAHLLKDVLCERIVTAEKQVTEDRENYLSSRMGRRQVETLIGKTNEKDIREGLRRSQQEIDEWFRSRMQ
jgi:flagellar export protein FliJ